jgi:ribonuclease HII
MGQLSYGKGSCDKQQKMLGQRREKTLPTVLSMIGVDENGLGSRLGPMTVTGVAIEIDLDKLPDREAIVRASQQAGLGDSKALCAHGSMAQIEGRVLALVHEHLGESLPSLTQLTSMAEVESLESLQADCPEGASRGICFDDPVQIPAFGPGITTEDRQIASALREAGFRLRAVAVVPVCTGRINLRRDKGVSRMALDLTAMLAIVDKLKPPSREAQVFCGKVGGQSKYLPALLARWPLAVTVVEKRERSSYRVPSVGELSFVMDGDASEPAISLASMVGKYARELWMHRHNRYWTQAVNGVSSVSGYHDPVTERLVRATALYRTKMQIPERCFERKSAAGRA